MWTNRTLPNVGIRVYGLGAMALGLVGLVWSDFADVWQPIQAFGNVPHRQALAVCAALLELFGGVAVQWHRTARAGVWILGISFFVLACFWLPRVIGFPQIFGTWGGFLEQFSLVAAAIILYASFAPADSAHARKTALLGRVLFGICVLAFGIEHFLYLRQTAQLVPKWIPPGQNFWAIATGLFHFLAAVSILTGVRDVLGSRLFTLMLIVFGALVWAPTLFTTPHAHMAWAGNAINLTLIGAAWVISDSIASRRQSSELTKDAFLTSEPISGLFRRSETRALRPGAENSPTSTRP